MSLRLRNRLRLICILLDGELKKKGGRTETAHLHSVLPMMIALFDPGHLSIDLSQDCCSALLGAHNGVVRYRRHKIPIVVAWLELDSPNATTRSVYKCTRSQKTLKDVHLLRFDFLDHPLLVVKQFFVLLCIE